MVAWRRRILTTTQRLSRPLTFLLAGSVLLAGCAAPEVLAPRDAAVPSGVDLSGDWRIRTDQREDERQLRQAIRRTDGVDEEDIYRPPSRQSSSRRSRSVKGGLVYVFLETGAALKVTQTDHALFISFDRAIVEEFRFGENRIVSVGEVQAQRVTGWVEDALVVETLDRNSMKLTDSYRLVSGGQVLERTITLRSSKGERETIVQLFDRAGQ